MTGTIHQSPIWNTIAHECQERGSDTVAELLASFIRGHYCKGDVDERLTAESIRKHFTLTLTADELELPDLDESPAHHGAIVWTATTEPGEYLSDCGLFLVRRQVGGHHTQYVCMKVGANENRVIHHGSKFGCQRHAETVKQVTPRK